MKDLLKMVVKKRSESASKTKDSETLTRFASRVAKLKGEGPMASSLEPEVALEVVSINIHDIEIPSNYMRKAVGDVSSLVHSIKLYGIQQPLKVIKIRGTNKYRLVFGRRRMKAAKMAGMDAVPCIVELLTREDRLMMLSLIENFNRVNLTPLEEGGGFKLMNKKSDITEDLSKNLGKTSDYIKQTVGFLSLPDSVQKDVINSPDVFTWGILDVLQGAYKSSSARGKKLFQAIRSGEIRTTAQARSFVQLL